MLDAYIIDRIRRERERQERETGRVPLRIEVPEPPPPEPAVERGRREERGTVVIDYTV